MPRLQHSLLQASPKENTWEINWYGAQIAPSDNRPLHWHDSLSMHQVHLIFNLYGRGIILGKTTRLSLAPSTLALCYSTCPICATRIVSDKNHEFIVLSLNWEWLVTQLQSLNDSLIGFISQIMDNKHLDLGLPIGTVRSMSLYEKDLAHQLAEPPIQKAAHPFWYNGKVSELLALELFSPYGNQSAPLLQERSHFLVSKRIDATLEWLESHLEEKLNLDELAAYVGCSPHYLSRIFSTTMHCTISQRLRAMRIDRASQLLQLGSYNVTRAALEVGYNSLSHFTKAFITEKGMKPSQYLDNLRNDL